MPQVRTLITTVAGAQFKAQHQATEEFWRRLAASNGGRQGDPHDYAEIVDIYYDEGRGWVIEYEVPAELLEQRTVSVIREEPTVQNVLEPANLADAAPVQAPKPRPKCHVLSCTSPCIEGSSYCDQHQDKDGRFKDTNQPTEIMPSLIQVTGHNPRKTFDPAQLEELKDSIREHGIIEPLMVRPKGNSRYELVVGERRLRAARELGLEHVPVVVRQLTDEQMLDIMLAENLQRVDLNPIEEAHHLKRVLEVGKLTQTELGRRVGKSQEWVSQRLRLAEAPAGLQDEIIRRRINPSAAADLLAWKDTEHFGLLLLRVDEAIREEVEDGGLGVTVKRVREIIKEITEPGPAPYGSIPFPVAPDVKEGEIQPGTMVVINTDGTVAPVYAAEASDMPFVNPEDCKDCDIYDRENDTCPEGCTCAEECEYCFCEVTEDEENGCEMFGVPGAADDEVCAVDCPDYDACKSEGEQEEDDDQDLPDEQETSPDSKEPRARCTINSDRSSLSYNSVLLVNDSGDVLMVNECTNRTEELGGVVTRAIGLDLGDTVPVTVVVRKGEITIRRRGKF